MELVIIDSVIRLVRSRLTLRQQTIIDLVYEVFGTADSQQQRELRTVINRLYPRNKRNPIANRLLDHAVYMAQTGDRSREAVTKLYRLAIRASGGDPLKTAELRRDFADYIFRDDAQWWEVEEMAAAV